MMKNFADNLIEEIKRKKSALVVGLDPNVNYFPNFLIKKDNSLEQIQESIYVFNKIIIDAVSEHVVAVKPQLAYYELYGSYGIKALEDTIKYAKAKDLLIINDAKRNDINTTSQAYAEAFLGKGPLSGDALTINPFLGSDGIVPFIQKADQYKKGIFVLLRSSNPSSVEFQDLITSNKKTVYIEIAEKLNSLSINTFGKYKYSFVGAVVGASYPGIAQELRKILKNCFFLVPGFGAQGASTENSKNFFNEDGFGALISSSRGIIYSYLKLTNQLSDITEQDVFSSIENEVINAKNEINANRKII